MLWDLYCRVIDNLGDIGVCWRLAADLGARGATVRLWVDDASALAFMAPGGATGVTVIDWNAAPLPPGDVVIEAFGCDPPPRFVQLMAQRAPPPLWINLEYLSAEPVAERNHGLPSPQFAGPGAGLTKRFYYPGFTPASGGVIREPDLLQRQQWFDAAAWLAQLSLPGRGAEPPQRERLVSLYCYDNPALSGLLRALAAQPTLLLVTPGAAARQVAGILGPGLACGALRAAMLPALSQVDFDHLLWSCDLNIVRGEDSWVRAQWAGRPFLWQAYPQRDGAHRAKLAAFIQQFLAGIAAPRAAPLQQVFEAWNGSGDVRLVLPEQAPWQDACSRWRQKLLAQDDLVTRLTRLAENTR